jgi:hypothetical protein
MSSTHRANCLINNLTIEIIVASKKMLLYSENSIRSREHVMSQQSKRELLQAIRPSYLKANKAGKTKSLDEFVDATGYHRKYAIRSE